MLIPADSERLAIIATGHVEPVVKWVETNGRRQPGDQEVEEGTGVPLWTVHGLIPTDTRPTLVGVRLPARECPQPAPYAPVVFERLVVNAKTDKSGRFVTYWSAAGLAEPRRATAQSRQEQAA